MLGKMDWNIWNITMMDVNDLVGMLTNAELTKRVNKRLQQQDRVT